MTRVTVVTLFALGAGCASPTSLLKQRAALTLGTSAFSVNARDDSVDVTAVQKALEQANERVALWGEARTPVTVWVLPSHEALERAVHRDGYSWLRAWARANELYLQAPSTWTRSEAEFNDLVAHELTHVVLFQRAGPASDRTIPLWFREGMAQWTAHQRARVTLEDLALWLTSDQHPRPFRDGEALSKDAFDFEYGLALHAFSLLVKRYGVKAINAFIDALASGGNFEDAFSASFGAPLATYEADFSTWLTNRSYRHERSPTD